MMDMSTASEKQLTLPLDTRDETQVGEAKPATRIRSKSFMERVVRRNNLWAAQKQVKKEGKSPGVDKMTYKGLVKFLKDNWPKIKEELLNGNYQPKPVKRVSIPKPGGGVRNLGVPTFLDRFIQQAILQVL